MEVRSDGRKTRVIERVECSDDPALAVVLPDKPVCHQQRVACPRHRRSRSPSSSARNVLSASYAAIAAASPSDKARGVTGAPGGARQPFRKGSRRPGRVSSLAVRQRRPQEGRACLGAPIGAVYVLAAAAGARSPVVFRSCPSGSEGMGNSFPGTRKKAMPQVFAAPLFVSHLPDSNRGPRDYKSACVCISFLVQ